MSDLPPPMTPPECDLRGLPFMPLNTVGLVDSDFSALSTGDEFKAGVTLWCKSWLQQPAASLPDDDRILAHLSGAGTKWKKVRAMALRGWVKCSDGRLYHRVIAEKAIEAWKGRLAQRARASKRWADQRVSVEETPPTAMPRHSPGTPTVKPNGRHGTTTAHATAMPGRGTVQGKEEREGRKRESVRAAPAPRASPIPDDWVPDESGYRLAEQHHLDPNRTLAKFIAYYRGTGAVRADWDAALVLWIEREQDFAGSGGKSRRNADSLDKTLMYQKLANLGALN